MDHPEPKDSVAALGEYLVQYGAFLKNTGRLELDHPELRGNRDRWTEVGQQLVAELERDQVAAIATVLPRLNGVAPRLREAAKLTPADRVDVGEDLDRLGRDLVRAVT